MTDREYSNRNPRDKKVFSGRGRGRGNFQTSDPSSSLSHNRTAGNSQHHHENGRHQNSQHRNRVPPPQEVPASGIPYGCVPAFLPGSASLVEQLDKKLMIILRDGRHLVGMLRSFDQFSNLVLENTSERRVLHVKHKRESEDNIVKQNSTEKVKKDTKSELCCYYTDIHLGLYIVRGDSVVLLGEIDNENKDISLGEENNVFEISPTESNEHPMVGSGLSNGTISSKNEAMVSSMSKFIKNVTLEEYEELEKCHEAKINGEDQIKNLVWEFDTDLVV